ncbi:hypothetical protein [Pseudomarimonas salicorniae]|uniref:DUF1579 domain-containing protein n=1 Tax=Pseudomarimonas salicorniae TaxID=2933270 RepID=A0ABT0GJW7_9GAMM|nr:hypothetical protein [Lysobacter sp. CAU 1642]MCK7594662.1 hypothetical protein [Lysobacter sp. CAU 1642]
MSDFSFQTGHWLVHHRKLAERLVGSRTWLEFRGTCSAWPLLDGMGNVEDQWLDDPSGAYRAAALRRRDPDTGQWSIWWHDGRSASLDPPVVGRFEAGVGRFFADDTLRGMPIRVRFEWHDTHTPCPRWEQAFSADDGATWELNWVMRFVRAKQGVSPYLGTHGI